jgi:hypothetical protein
MEELDKERLLDLIERQQLIIDAIFSCLDDEQTKYIMCEIADRIYLEVNKKISHNGDNN